MIKKLEIGCGNEPLSFDPEWDRMDIVSYPHITIVGDIRKIPRPDNYYDEVYSHWVLEHFHRNEIASVIKEWMRVVKPGGKMSVITSNAEAINKALVDKVITWNQWNYLTFANRDNGEAGLHKVGFSPEYLLSFFTGYKTNIQVQIHCKNAKGELSCPGIIIEVIKI